MTAPAAPALSTPAAPSGTASETPGQNGANETRANPSDPTQPSSAEGQEQETRGPDYFRQAFNRLRGIPDSQAPLASTRPARETERSADDGSGGVQPSAEGGEQRSKPEASRQEPPASGQTDDAVTLTRDQLARMVQAEADRIYAKRQRDEQARREREEEVELRRNNPIEYVRRLEEKEQEARTAQQKLVELGRELDSQILTYDRNVLDTFVSALPDDTRKKVVESVSDQGIPGRAKIAAGTLKALKDHWTAEGARTARERLLKDESFVKEVLARHGGQRFEPEPSPSLPTSSAPTPPDGGSAMNAWMRSAQTAVVSGR